MSSANKISSFPVVALGPQETLMERSKEIYVKTFINGYAQQRSRFFTEENQSKSLPFDEKVAVKFELPKINNIYSNDMPYSTVICQWTGHVIAINECSFTAKVKDVTSSNWVYEIAEFDKEDLDEDDLKMLKTGNEFYWSISYDDRNGTRTKGSSIRFKRLPDFNEKQIDNALDLANDLFENINWGD